ncbi:hypothetical protein BO94DRAFT_243942 [Aspergillus sclerotioniger CBS 115572]|uniref:Uncharacterized protein n=1 Tax=Aspergillus sclerotioniger CBS 115572 TaxID=1450535 RepID=A0A317VJN0_9EURO|nr:hypothetical protein BO94DRAFT_243942 [Aspergillus sclerotioniger CBS 115572]PWY73218.1 hypothetical protein BO94DRAFT_243942 [Aspergillus sclerotioniger CBS 115572]
MLKCKSYRGSVKYGSLRVILCGIIFSMGFLPFPALENRFALSGNNHVFLFFSCYGFAREFFLKR